MEINKKFFPDIITDNEEIFISKIIGVIESIDELSHLQISKLEDGYQFRISSSIPIYNELLLKEITKFHTIYGIHLDLSKSIKSSGTIIFKIEFA